MTTEHKVIQAELHRAVLVLDEDHMAEKRAEQPDLPALVLAKASICGHGGASVSWTLTGTPPEGRTLSEAVADLGITLHERWPATWR